MRMRNTLKDDRALIVDVVLRKVRDGTLADNRHFRVKDLEGMCVWTQIHRYRKVKKWNQEMDFWRVVESEYLKAKVERYGIESLKGGDGE